MSLKEKTLNGLLWSFVDNFVTLGVQFVVGIILARLLSPREFGLIGMLTIFIALSQSMVDSGFSNALIRKTNCTQKDYSTIFFFNLLVGLVVYTLLYFSSDAVSIFFNEPQLKPLLKVLGLGVIFNALGLIQKTILTKEINFKLQTKITIYTTLLTGSIAIGMAYKGFGVWSLVALTLGRFGFNTLFLWLWGSWKITIELSRKSFDELFSFGYKLLISGILHTLYSNLYYFIIGKYFSAVQLGHYTRADQFKQLPSQNITTIIQRVSYPVLSQLKDDKIRLLKAFRQVITSTMFLSLHLMLGMAAVAKPMILSLIGEKWLPSVEYLQLLCFVGMLFPLHAINLNLLQVLGRSDLFLKLEIIKKIIAIPTIIIGIYIGIKALIIAMFVTSIIAFFLNSYWSGKLLNYSSLAQLSDLKTPFISAVFMASLVYFINFAAIDKHWLKLTIQIITGLLITILSGELLKLRDYQYMKSLVLEKLSLLK